MKTKVETKFASLWFADSGLCSDVHAYNLHVIKINLRYGTGERGGQKGKRPRASRQGRPGMGWAAVPSSV